MSDINVEISNLYDWEWYKAKYILSKSYKNTKTKTHTGHN